MGNKPGAPLPQLTKNAPCDVLWQKTWRAGLVVSVSPKHSVTVAIQVRNRKLEVDISRKDLKKRLAVRGTHTGASPGSLPSFLEPQRREPLPGDEGEEMIAALRAREQREREVIEEARAKASARRGSGPATGRPLGSAASAKSLKGGKGKKGTRKSSRGLISLDMDAPTAAEVVDVGDPAEGASPVSAGKVPLAQTVMGDSDRFLAQALAEADGYVEEEPVQFVDVLDMAQPLKSDLHDRLGIAASATPPPPRGGWRWRPAVIERTTDEGKVVVRYLDTDSVPAEYHETGEVNMEDTDSFAPYETKASPQIVHHSFKEGDVLDVQDHFQRKNGKGIGKKWRKCQVVKTSGQYFIRVTFVGWSKAYDEWFHVLEQGERLAEFGSHTEKDLKRKEGLDGVFKKNLQHDRQLTVVAVEPDGNCLFRAVAHQVYGDVELHETVRSECCDYLEKNRDRFEPLLETGQFEAYVENLRKLKVWGDDPEVRAMEELYDRPVEVFVANGLGTNTDPLKMHFEGDLPSDEAMGEYMPIRLSFHGNNHYNSVIPFVTREEAGEDGKTVMKDISADAWDAPKPREDGIIRRHRNVQVASHRFSAVPGFAVATQDFDDDDDDNDDEVDGASGATGARASGKVLQAKIA